MRKICFILLSIVLIGTAWGQESSEINRSRIPSPALSKNKPGIINQPVVSKLAIWSSDFSNANDWTIGNSAGNAANWTISNTPTFWWSGNSALASSSGMNAASFNSDAFATGNNQIQNNAWIQNTIPINCSSQSGIEITFQQYYSKWTSKTYVEVSNNNGQTWTDFEVNSNLTSNEDTDNPSLAAVNISSVAGNQSSVLIRILFLSNAISDGGSINIAGVAWDYGWIIDDVQINTLPNNDVALLDAWHANLSAGLEYSKVPLAQVREMVPALVVQNQGGMSQNVDIECTISGGSGVVNTITMNHTVLFGNTDTIYFYSGFVPTAIDEYQVSFSIDADDDPSNDSISALPLKVTDYVMAHDYGALGYYGWNPESLNIDVVNFASATHSWGNVFEMEANQTIYSVGVNFAIGTTNWLHVKARVQMIPMGGTIQDPLTLINEIDYYVQPSKIGSGITIITFDSPSLLLEGKSYIIDIVKVEDGTTSKTLAIGGSEIGSEDDDFSTVGFGPYGIGGEVNYFNNWGFAPLIRANFSELLSTEEVLLSKVNLYPNPSRGIFSITDNNDSEKYIEIIDLKGKVILTAFMNSNVKIDLRDTEAGIYIVKLSSYDTSVIKRIVIQ